MLFLAFLPEISSFFLFLAATTQRFGIGTMLVIVQLLLAGMLFLARPAAFIETALRWWPLLLVPILCAVSALWSTAPAESFRYGLQLLFSSFLGVHLARLMTPGRYVAVFLLAFFVFSILCIIDGRQGISADGMVLIGLTGSKNQIGLVGVFLLLSAMATFFMGGISILMRWVALLAVPLAGFLLWNCHSATALLMAAGGVLVLFVMWFAQRLPPNGRLAAIVGGLLVLAPLAALTPEASEAVDHFVFDTLNKDPTLTGRTILWARADELIAQRPILGWGYQAIWMGDSFETIGLQRLTGITDGRAFHFHNQFRQTGVDTGFVGLIALVSAMLVTLFAGFRQALLTPHPATSFFYVVFVLMIVRSFTDTIIQPFSIHTMLLFASCVYAFWRPSLAPSEAEARAFAMWPALRLLRPVRRGAR